MDLSIINNLKISFPSGNSQLRAPKTPDIEKVGCQSLLIFVTEGGYGMINNKNGFFFSTVLVASDGVFNILACTTDPAPACDL